MLASLGMYDWHEARKATDELWRSIAAALAEQGVPDVPDQLDRTTPVQDQWRSPDLLFSQTCGYPLTHEFDGHLELLATPIYGVEGCDGPTYTSAIVVHHDSKFQRPEDLRGSHAIYNSLDSLSGHLALRSVFASLADSGRFFGKASCSGGHPYSMDMVANGEADVAAIDCVSFAFCTRYRSETAGKLRVIARSPPAPSLPYVTAKGRPAAQRDIIKNVLATVFNDPTLADTRGSLFIEGLEFTTRQSYDVVLEQEFQVQSLGYGELC